MKFVIKKAPKRRSYVHRLTDLLRSMPVDPEMAFTVDSMTLRTLRGYAKARGWEIVQQTQPDGSILFWRGG